MYQLVRCYRSVPQMLSTLFPRNVFILLQMAFWGLSTQAFSQDTLSLLERPGQDGLPVNVYISMVVLDISKIDNTNQLVSATVFFTAEWVDARLKHRKGVETYSVDKANPEIWSPILLFLNGVDFEMRLPHVARVNEEGKVQYRQGVTAGFVQNMHFKNFPFDQQKIEFTLVAVANADRHLQFQVDSTKSSGFSQEFLLPGWNVDSVKLKPEPLYILGDEGPPLDSFKFVLWVSRKKGYFILNILIPLFAVVSMSWVAFWLKPEMAEAQFGIGVSTMLTLIAYRFALSNEIPNISYLTRMDLLLLGSTLLVSFALLESVVTTHLVNSGRREFAVKIDKICRYLIPLVFFALIFYTMKGAYF